MHALNGVDLRHDLFAIRQEGHDVLVKAPLALQYSLLFHEHLLLLLEHHFQHILLPPQVLLLLQELCVLLHDLHQGSRAAEACLAALDALVCDVHWRCRGGVLELLLDVLTPTDADPTRARLPLVHRHVGAPTSAATDKAIFALADAYRLREPGHVDAIERVPTKDARRLVGWLAFLCPVEQLMWALISASFQSAGTSRSSGIGFWGTSAPAIAFTFCRISNWGWFGIQNSSPSRPAARPLPSSQV